MSLEDRLKRKQATLDEINKALKDVHPKRLRRKRDEKDAQRDKEDAIIERLLDNQLEAMKEREHLEDLLERLQDDDPTNDPPDRTEQYLIAEIDLLDIEIEERDEKLDQHRNKKQAHVARFRELDKKTKKHRERQMNLEKRKRRVLDAIEDIKKEMAEKQKNEWPGDMVVAELLYHLNHLHFASPERNKLITIGHIMVEWGIRVGEFPPFDTVECVHVDPGSWHYRDSGSPYVARSCAGRGDGLAIDANDANMVTSTREVAFYHELVRRYR